MPQPFNSAVLTNLGEELLAEATAGHCQIEYVHMAIGDGSYTSAEKSVAALKARTALKSQKNTYAFSSVTVENENCVTLIALLTNQDPATEEILVTTGYYINEVGIFAKRVGEDDSAAVLYSIAVTASSTGSGDYMPPYNGVSRAEITQRYMITVDNSANITVNMKGAALLAEDANILTDDTTLQKYRLGINEGKIYYEEVE